MYWLDQLALWLRKLRRRWKRGGFSTPFETRRSLRILRKIHEDEHPIQPYRHLAWLFLRLPWSLPCVLPPPPHEIMAYDRKAYMYQHHYDLLDLRLIPLWRWRDTPQRSFFRLYEAFCANHSEFVGYETEYFWKHGDPAWAVDRLSDPREYGVVDHEQLAVFASLAEALAESFNWRLMWGWRRDGRHVDRTSADGPPVYASVLKPPPWTTGVPRLEERLVVHDFGQWQELCGLDDDDGFTGELSPFEKRNIEAGDASLRTV